MKKVAYITLATLCIGILPLQTFAQPYSFGGAVLNRDILQASDMAMLSQPQNFGTSRSMAMGGAFVSLGADMSSMSLNPAGMGMFRRSEFSLTPLVSISNSSTKETASWQGNGKNRFSFANIGLALNVYESATKKLTSVTLGFGMNRIADFNTRSSFSTESRYNPADGFPMPTIAEIYFRQLNQAGIFPSVQTNGDPNGELRYGGGVGTVHWPAVLGYNGYMTSVVGSGDNRRWIIPTIGNNASVIHSMDVVNSGSINEFALSAGANFSNIVYVGATLGIQSVYKASETTYQEEYRYYDSQGIALNAIGEPLAEQLDYSSLWQRTVVSGSGVNFKLGVIVRPIPALRIGVAIHTPTFYSLNFAYRADIETRRYKNPDDEKNYIAKDATPEQRDQGGNSWEFTSPTKLMFGASYTLGTYAVLSVDYERDWYNGIRAKNFPEFSGLYREDYKSEFKTQFCATNAVRAGLEVKPLLILALRVGGGYTSSMLKNEELYFNSPVATTSHYITAGLGVTLSRSMTLDLAYQYLSQKYTQYELFFSLDNRTGEFDTHSGLYDTALTRHFLSMSLGFRF